MKLDIGEDNHDSIQYVEVSKDFYVDKGMLKWLENKNKFESENRQKEMEKYRINQQIRSKQKDKEAIWTFIIVAIMIFIWMINGGI